MTGAILLTLALAPQIIPVTCEAVIADRGAQQRGLPFAALGLGSGGVRPVPAGAAAVGAAVAGELTERGACRTPGGVRVVARLEGVKLDFASGRELLCTPDGRIHLRSGEKTLPFLRGVRLQLADGAVLTVQRGAQAGRPLASVAVEVEGRSRRLWSGTQRVRNGSRIGAFRGPTVVALGDGGTLYMAHVAGPLVALQRVLCPQEAARKSPRRRLVVLGDVLAASMRMLPAHAPRKSVQFPQVKEAAQRFAALGRLFRGTTPRPPGAVGELWFQLADDYRLKVETTVAGVLVIGFYGGSAGVPGVEWTIAGRNEIHFVRPSGGRRGGPRYFQRGIDLRELVDDLPGQSGPAQRAKVAELVAALGGRRPQTLEVKRR